MIRPVDVRIQRGAEVDGPKGDAGPRRHGLWEYHAVAYPLVFGYSRQPLSDACRQLKSLYGLTGQTAGVFRDGSDVADISCVIETGALVTAKDQNIGGIRFGKYVPFEAFGRTLIAGNADAADAGEMLGDAA
jgi:hypothetical protein